MTNRLSSETDSVIYKTSAEGISQIIINRPSQRNAVDSPTGQKMYDAFLAFDKDDTQKVCILSGMYDQFCAGFDLREAAGLNPGDDASTAAASNNKDKDSHLQPVAYNPQVSNMNRAPMGPSRLMLSKPLIAAISGYAVAGGLELSLLADIRIASEDSTFGVFCRRFGVPLIDGGTVRLPAIVGLGRAMDMILTGRPVGAREALEMGLISRVVQHRQDTTNTTNENNGNGDDVVVEEAFNVARQLLKFPQLCMNLDRRSAYYATFQATSLEDALRFEFENGVKCVGEESARGAASFVHRRSGRHAAGSSSKL